jgi:hypothetical protein
MYLMMPSQLHRLHEIPGDIVHVQEDVVEMLSGDSTLLRIWEVWRSDLSQETGYPY